ncbi:hypothetical protein BGZ54_007038 [Gamsiella multidivaricata]|nr:hypothetical protein BGZ54_007038 [Gamsiella multidivaricata]
MAQLSLFDIQLLKDEITQYLSEHDLVQCTLVSKDWLAWFSPALWRTLNFARSTPHISALITNQHYVLSVTAFHKYLASISLASVPFPNLQSLDHTPDYGTPCNEDQVLRFIKATPSLRCVKLTLSLSQESVLQQLIDTLRSHPALMNLDLSCREFTDPNSIQQIIEACQYYDSLHLKFGDDMPSHVGHYHNYGDGIAHQIESCRTAKVAMDQMQDMRIRALSIRISNANQEPAIIVPLLRRCPNLEMLHLIRIHHEDTLPQVVSLFSEDRYCTKLKDVRMGYIRRNDNTAALQADFLRLLGHDSGNGCSDNGFRHGLEKLTLSRAVEFNEQSILALSNHHVGSLTTVDFSKLCMSTTNFIHLMTSLPKLRSLYAVLEYTRTDTQAVLLQKQWICLELRILELNIDLICDDNQFRAPAWKGSPADSCMTYLFSQIGILTKLQQWRLQTSDVDLWQLEGGYLGLLAGLKQLRACYFERLFPIRFQIGTRVAEWMIEHWPRLIHVGMLNGFAKERLEASDRHALHAFTETLLANRPWLQVD